MSQSRPATDGRSAARIIAVYGARRGVGTTTLACNLAVALSQRGASVAILDGDLAFGGVPTTFGLAPEALASGSNRHSSGVLVAAQPEGWLPGHSDSTGARAIDRLLEDASGSAHLLIVDTPAPLTPATRRVLDASQVILLVLTPEETALEHARRFVEFCASHGLFERVHVVINRNQSRSGLSGERIATEFGDRLVGRVNSGGLLVAGSINAGEPFVQAHPDHPLSIQMHALATAVVALVA
jgi:pilus assembly protein CpaE